MSEDGTFIAVIAQDTLYPNLAANNQRKGSVHIFKLKDNKYTSPNIMDPSLTPIIENLKPSII